MLAPLLHCGTKMTPSKRGMVVGMRHMGATFAVIEEELELQRTLLVKSGIATKKLVTVI
jgi:hypothetical protein